MGFYHGLLGLLLPVLAFRSLRSMKGGGTIAAILAAGTLMMLEAVTGFRMIPESKAILSGPVLSVAGGGTTTSFSLSNGNTYPVTNSSGVTQVIRSINWTFNSGGVQVTTGAGYCAVGTTLIQNATCNLRITLNLGL